MDQFTKGGVDIAKGCYVGQEVVSRMKHRDSARNRFVKVHGAQNLPGKGTPLTVDGRQVGTMGSSITQDGLALVRIDKVGRAIAAEQPILAGKDAVTLAIPDFTNFTWGA